MKLASNRRCTDSREPVQSSWIEHFSIIRPPMCHISIFHPTSPVFRFCSCLSEGTSFIGAFATVSYVPGDESLPSWTTFAWEPCCSNEPSVTSSVGVLTTEAEVSSDGQLPTISSPLNVTCSRCSQHLIFSDKLHRHLDHCSKSTKR